MDSHQIRNSIILKDSQKTSLTELLLANIEQEVPIYLAEECTHSFSSFIRGYHAYMGIWQPSIGDCNLDVMREEGNIHDQFAIGIFQNNVIMGHAPKCISKALSKFLTLPNCSITVTVTGKKVNRGGGYGLEIPTMYTVFGPYNAVEWIKKQIAKEFEVVKNKTTRCMK